MHSSQDIYINWFDTADLCIVESLNNASTFIATLLSVSNCAVSNLFIHFIDFIILLLFVNYEYCS